MDKEKKYSEEDIAKFFEWYNIIQWRGGEGDPIKQLFCKCNYEKLVKQCLKELRVMDFKNKPIFGMIHLAGVDDTIKIDRALAEIDILVNEGVDGIIVENYHGSFENVKALLKLLVNEYKGYLGINILPNEYETAFNLADKFNADFVQIDYVAGEYVNTKKINPIEFNKLRYKYPGIAVLGGVHPKYYKPVDGSILQNDIHIGINVSDAIVVTGEGTGKETPLDKIKLFRKLMDSNNDTYVVNKHHPLIIGAGLDSTNVLEQLPFADGAIVGSCFKPYKRTNEMINKDLVREFMDKVKQVRENIK